MSLTPPHSATLDALLAGMAGAPPLPVAGLRLDSRAIRPGEAFVAVQGASAHGLDFVQQALDAGAAADLPAWCRLTGHTLVAADHPTYVLKKRDV